MNRPTKEEVDAALAFAEAAEYISSESVLAAEVRALREEADLLGRQLQVSASYALSLCGELERRSERACSVEAAGDPIVHELQIQRRDLEAEVKRLRKATLADESWVRLGTELAEAETERDRLRGELANARAFNERAFAAEVKALQAENEKLRAEIEELNAKLKRAADWALGL